MWVHDPRTGRKEGRKEGSKGLKLMRWVQWKMYKILLRKKIKRLGHEWGRTFFEWTCKDSKSGSKTFIMNPKPGILDQRKHANLNEEPKYGEAWEQQIKITGF
jgi:hypothetical protein